MSNSLPHEEFERAYEIIARALDRVGPERERLFLARLALALAHQLPDLKALKQALAIAEGGLENESGQGSGTR
jgi:hypothetical protein